MADKTYTDDEKRTLRVLKMQEGDLAQLREQKQGELHDLDNMAKRLSAMKERVKSLAEMTGTELPEEHHAPTLTQAKTKERMDRRFRRGSHLKRKPTNIISGRMSS